MSKTLDEHNYHGIDATIIADSKNEHGQRITSFVCTFPRIVLAEFNTHRMLSRNSASSRAIPFEKMLKQIEEHPFIPIKWMKDHSGMQGDEYFTVEDKCIDHIDGFNNGNYSNYRMPRFLRDQWLLAREEAIEQAILLSEAGLTKQFVNRLLEPFKWHTVIVTATEWENFFALRADKAAEIHIQDLAFKMLQEYNDSEPKHLKAGEWHIPFGDNMDESRIDKLDFVKDNSMFYTGEHNMPDVDEYDAELQARRVAIATARCARVSYENFEGGDDYQKDINLHDRLSSMGHWSPFEHCAKAMSKREFTRHNVLGDHKPTFGEKGWCGNFQGFVQYRKMFDNENKKDNRVK